MAFKVVISKEAEIEVDDALQYYKRFSNQTAKSFQKQLNFCYKKLKENPFFQVRYLNVRGLPLSKYPYLLLFRISEEKKTVFILSVFCTHQNPEKYP